MSEHTWLNVPNLQERWSVTTGSDIQSSPAVVKGVLYVLCSLYRVPMRPSTLLDRPVT
jgi:hypothetical protein